MSSLALGLYAVCVDFLIRVANLIGVTYRDSNALLFFVIWPLVTVVLLVIRVRQRRALARLLALSEP